MVSVTGAWESVKYRYKNSLLIKRYAGFKIQYGLILTLLSKRIFLPRDKSTELYTGTKPAHFQTCVKYFLKLPNLVNFKICLRKNKIYHISLFAH